ncbi:hypothetical protein GUJ93_ZPchr0012g19542 [Zizania palustris]|uniref:Uncharacterized protein n=1 Tax=Zizania palustris TaxID=103762 RepID=A0A8J5WT39_ZIZPA|nr:hypothetical protein GUJ93_ZPchr0012g19542 [Zizania palustris]
MGHASPTPVDLSSVCDSTRRTLNPSQCLSPRCYATHIDVPPAEASRASVDGVAGSIGDQVGERRLGEGWFLLIRHCKGLAPCEESPTGTPRLRSEMADGYDQEGNVSMLKGSARRCGADGWCSQASPFPPLPSPHLHGHRD